MTADLFPPAYNKQGIPGFKEKGGASEDAARGIASKAKVLRERVYDLFDRYDNLTADECAALLKEDILSIRPRCSELFKSNLLKKTNIRLRS